MLVVTGPKMKWHILRQAKEDSPRTLCGVKLGYRLEVWYWPDEVINFQRRYLCKKCEKIAEER